MFAKLLIYTKTHLLLSLWLLMLALSPQAVMAAGGCTPWAAKLVSLQGSVEVQSTHSQAWQAGVLDATYCPGDTIRVGANSRAAVVLPNETLLRLDQNTVITLTAVETEAESLLELLSGIVNFISRVPYSLKVNTPYVNASIEGTEFVLAVKEKQVDITVFEGTVLAQNPQGELRLTSGESATAVDGQAPSKVIVVRPRDAVQWALYYPPLLDIREGKASLTGAALPSATERLNAGDVAGALSSLDTVPPGLRDANFYTYRAAVRLYVGRVDDAHEDLKRAFNLDPANGTAIALQSVIAVTQNDKDQAQQLAQQAAELSSETAAPQIALSYAHQARFDLDAALASTQRAVELEADNALAWARLAELRLSIGELDAALAAAEKAVELDPNLSRSQSILGYAYLTKIKLEDASASFDKAVQLDSTSPLARLGLGLSKVRKGELETGRQDIEIATSLDPSNALIRSYLGKAYYEEKRDSLAEVQLSLAKELDPLDPTPWLYRAILELTRNRPVKALHDLEESIARNENRAVYRSKLLLDEDLASRSASLARIYDELGFEEVAILESTKSLDIDPGNFSAHRFLADAFARKSGHEIASVSERLQAQLFQPINVLPVQPQLTVTDLAITSGLGPSTPSLNEYTPLFQADGPHLLVSLFGGNQDTWGDELVLSGVHQRLSYSLGQFHAESDGFRDNNDSQYDLYNLFGQFALSPKLNLQMELRRRQSEQGDLRLRFDLDDFDPTFNRSIDQDTVRLGAKFSPRPDSDLILSAFYSDRKENGQEREPLAELNVDNEQDGYQAEARYLFRSDLWNVTLGLGRYDVDEDNKFVTTFDPIIIPPLPGFPGPPIVLPPPPPIVATPSFDLTHDNAYTYANLAPWDDMEFTLGLSYDDYSDGSVDTDRFNPKFGLRWDATKWMQVRLAAFKTVKRALVVNQTIEPTQIAGFNQFFDDFNGTRTTRYGAGLEFRPSASILAGFEYSKRDMNVPIRNFQGEDASQDDQDVKLFNAYGYWTIDKRWALRGEVMYEDFDGDSSSSLSGPTNLNTTLVPVGLNYHRPNGFFANVAGTYIHQKIKPDTFSTGSGGSATDDGIIANLGMGFRLPKRRGIIDLTVENLFDKQINFQDNSFRTPTQNVQAPYSPERALRLVLSLNF